MLAPYCIHGEVQRALGGLQGNEEWLGNPLLRPGEEPPAQKGRCEGMDRFCLPLSAGSILSGLCPRALVRWQPLLYQALMHHIVMDSGPLGTSTCLGEGSTLPGVPFAVASAVSRILFLAARDCFSVSIEANFDVRSCSCSSTRFAFSFA